MCSCDPKTCVLLYLKQNTCFTGYNSASYVRHTQMSFLRRVHVSNAILYLRNYGIIPFMSDPMSMPEGMRQVDNFCQFKTMFYVEYCKLEGLPRSSDLARANLLYVFNGTCEVRESKRGPKRSSIIFEVQSITPISYRVKHPFSQT